MELRRRVYFERTSAHLRGCVADKSADHSTDFGSFSGAHRGTYRSAYRSAYRDTLRDTYRDTLRDTYRGTHRGADAATDTCPGATGAVRWDAWCWVLRLLRVHGVAARGNRRRGWLRGLRLLR